MSIFNDYSHQVLHHQTEHELIQRAEHRRLAREARDANPGLSWWRRLAHSDQRRAGIRPVAADGARQRYAH